MVKIESFGFSTVSKMEIKLKEFSVNLIKLEEPEKYQRVLLKKTKRKKSKYECDLCEFKCTHKFNITHHMRKHLSVNSFQCKGGLEHSL